jgi:hypothetical protein
MDVQVPRAAPDSVGNLRAAIHDELIVLRGIDAYYAKLRDSLNDWTDVEAVRDHILQTIDERHRRDREPHVLRVAELHEQVKCLLMARMMTTERSSHPVR